MLPTFSTLGTGETVVMLHGIGGGHLSFAPQVETLAYVGYRAVAWDMPGYGYSPPIEPYTFKGLAQACIRLIDALQCDSVVLLGHSMGGMVAQEVIARRPDRVHKLVLCGTSAAFARHGNGSSADAWAQRFVAERSAPLDAGQTMEQLARALVPAMAGPAALPEGLRLAERCMASVPAATYRRALDCLVSFDRQAALPGIGVPTLLVGGEHDRVATPAVMQRMARAIPRAQYVELPGVGHLMNLEAPDAFDRLLLDFLRTPGHRGHKGLH